MEYVDKFSVGKFLAKAKILMTHLQGVQNQMLEDLAVEQSHLTFLETSATELKNSRRSLRRYFLQSLIGKDTRERDYSARSSMTQERLASPLFNPNNEVHDKANLRVATSNYTSYYNLSAARKKLSPSEFRDLDPFVMNKASDLNLYTSIDNPNSGSDRQDDGPHINREKTAPTKDILIPEVEHNRPSVSPAKKEINLVHRRMNSPKATSRLVEILSQIGKAKQTLVQQKPDLLPNSKPLGHSIREIKSLVSSPKQNGVQEITKFMRSTMTADSKIKPQQGSLQKSALAQQNASISINITQYGLGSAQQSTGGRRVGGITKVRSLESYKLVTMKSTKPEQPTQQSLHKPSPSSLVTPDKRSVPELSPL